MSPWPLGLTRADLASRGHFTVLLFVLIMCLFVLMPILRFFPVLKLALDLFFIFILGWSCYTISDSRRTFLRGISLAALAIIAGTIAATFEDPQIEIVSLASSSLFCMFMTLTILGRILQTRDITLDAIFGGICAYLFCGLLWAYVYAIIDTAAPGSFTISNQLMADTPQSSFRPNLLFVYFSFVTLTTLGYGDMSPISETARSLAVLEAIVGPFFMAILIGWLVGRAGSHLKSANDSDTTNVTRP